VLASGNRLSSFGLKSPQNRCDIGLIYPRTNGEEEGHLNRGPSGQGTPGVPKGVGTTDDWSYEQGRSLSFHCVREPSCWVTQEAQIVPCGRRVNWFTKGSSGQTSVRWAELQVLPVLHLHFAYDNLLQKC